MASPQLFLARVAGHTVTEGLLGVEPGTELPPIAWPVVEALTRDGLARYRIDAGEVAPSLPMPVQLPPTEVQSAEKAALIPWVLTLDLVDAIPRTIGVHVNLSLQALSLPGAAAFVASTLAAAVARDTDVAVIDALEAAAGTAVADVDAAVAALAPWPGPRVVATGPVDGAADLLAAADSSGGALSVVYDPNLGSDATRHRASRCELGRAGRRATAGGGVGHCARPRGRGVHQRLWPGGRHRSRGEVVSTMDRPAKLLLATIPNDGTELTTLMRCAILVADTEEPTGSPSGCSRPRWPTSPSIYGWRAARWPIKSRRRSSEVATLTTTRSSSATGHVHDLAVSSHRL